MVAPGLDFRVLVPLFFFSMAMVRKCIVVVFFTTFVSPGNG